MTGSSLHLLKLCVGADRVEDLTDWQAGVMARAAAEGRPAVPVHVTRMWPRRSEDLLGGGSLYWVFKGLVLARQRIVALAPQEGADGITRCAIALDPVAVRVRPQPRRPFRGWRYLAAADAPPDLAPGGDGAALLPPAMAADLAVLGVV
jgi:hypothetical protein